MATIQTAPSANIAPVSATTALQGLSDAEAARRLRKEGPNRLVRRERLRTLGALLSALADPMALMLAAAGTVYFLLGDARDGAILLISLVPVLGVDVALDLRSRAALRKLAEAVSPLARVLRGAAEKEIASESIVRGDLLLLREGEIVQADGVVRAHANLSMDESQLTGESEPQEKREGEQVYAGSLVLGGQGAAEVTQTGQRTRFGEIAELVARTERSPTPLQRKTAQLVRRLGAVALLLAAGMTLFALWRGEGAGRALLSGISLAMAALPEEFPLVLALFLSVGAYRLSKGGVLVRRLASVETLGSTTVICTDKTGTLTFGRFSLEEIVPLGTSENALLSVAVQACEQDPEEPMERAILERARERGAPSQLHAGVLAVDYSFDPVEKYMAHVWREPSGSSRLAAKGAPEGLLRRCLLSPDARAAALGAYESMAERGRRVLAVAERSGAFCGERDRDVRDLRLVGLLGFSDPMRPQVPAAIDECRRAGVLVKIVTGDSPITARAIAEAAGIPHDQDGGILDGAQLSAADPARILRASIYARVQPGQKHLIVDAHQQAGEIVAMTGDGINDAPALRRADVGVSMGVRGTAVARAAADLVLLRDDFGALVTAIREGRRVFANLVKAFLFLIAFHVPVIALAVLVPLAGMPPLLLPIHLVWLELIVHPVSALVFEGDEAEGAMRRPPRDPRAPILPRRPLLLSLLSGALIAGAAFLLYAERLSSGTATARSAAIAVVITGGLLLVLAERRAKGTVRLFVVCGAVALSLPLAIHVPALAAALQLAPLDLAGWVTSLALAAASVAWRLFLR
jgi:P-type Ca2+ transporter type 2C